MLRTGDGRFRAGGHFWLRRIVLARKLFVFGFRLPGRPCRSVPITVILRRRLVGVRELLVRRGRIEAVQNQSKKRQVRPAKVLDHLLGLDDRRNAFTRDQHAVAAVAPEDERILEYAGRRSIEYNHLVMVFEKGDELSDRLGNQETPRLIVDSAGRQQIGSIRQLADAKGT